MCRSPIRALPRRAARASLRRCESPAVATGAAVRQRVPTQRTMLHHSTPCCTTGSLPRPSHSAAHRRRARCARSAHATCSIQHATYNLRQRNIQKSARNGQRAATACTALRAARSNATAPLATVATQHGHNPRGIPAASARKSRASAAGNARTDGTHGCRGRERGHTGDGLSAVYAPIRCSTVRSASSNAPESRRGCGPSRGADVGRVAVRMWAGSRRRCEAESRRRYGPSPGADAE
jgi:hypothetical protein